MLLVLLFVVALVVLVLTRLLPFIHFKNITTMFVGIFTIDDWHLANGIHCPNLLTWTSNDIDTLIDRMWNRVDDCVAYDWHTGVHTQITKEFIKNEFANAKYGNLRIYFTKPREGIISIIDTDKY